MTIVNSAIYIHKLFSYASTLVMLSILISNFFVARYEESLLSWYP